MHRKTTMNLGACVGYRGSLTTNRLSIGNSDHNRSNLCNGKSFFDDKNYRWIIKCMDDGYGISTDLIEYMQDYYDFQLNISHRLTSYSTKWISKLTHQSSLSSYHTTKRAQLQVVRSPQKLAQHIQTRCDTIQQVIATYKKQVNKMYPSERFGSVHKHYRSNDMERSFKHAYSYVRRVSETLVKLREREKRAEDALRDAKIQCQNLKLDETTSKNKLSRAHDHQENKQRQLQTIKERITRTEEEYNQEREIYREKATKIYQECRDLEEERIDQIRETLIKFIQAIHSPEYSTEEDEIYENLLSDIKSEQDTQTDLDFWAHTYRVTVSEKPILSETNENDDITEAQTTVEKTKDSQKNDIAHLTTIDEDINQLVVEDQEEQLVADSTTIPAKTKPKKKKTNIPEPTTPDAT